MAVNSLLDAFISGPPGVQSAVQNLITRWDPVRIYGDQANQVVNFNDASAVAILPWQDNKKSSSSRSAFELQGLIGLSVSEHQDKFPITSFGRTANKGYTVGNAVVGGSLIFNTLMESPFSEIIYAYASNIGQPQFAQFYTIKDLPPFDLDITFVAGDAPATSYLKIRGLAFVDYSMNMSIDNFKMIESAAFMAQHWVPLHQTLPSIRVEEKAPTSNTNAGTVHKTSKAPSDNSGAPPTLGTIFGVPIGL